MFPDIQEINAIEKDLHTTNKENIETLKQKHRAKLLSIVLKRSIDVDISDEYGNFAIHYAAKYCDMKSVKKLVAYDISQVNKRNSEKQTPLEILRENKNNGELNTFDYDDLVKFLTYKEEGKITDSITS